MDTKRPILVTLASIWIVISAAIMIVLSLSGFADITAAWYPTYLGIGGILYLASAVGLWMMRRWGMVLLALFSVVNQIVLITLGRFSIASLLMSIVLVLVGASQYSKLK